MTSIPQAEHPPEGRRRADPSPTVSVIVPAYKAARFIAESLQSVFAQTFPDFEVIVINDGSPDAEELRAVLAPYRHRIVYLEQGHRGPAGARNTAIRAARGELLGFLDSDDCWLPEFLNEQVTFLKQEPPADLVYSDAVVFGEHISGTPTLMQSGRAPNDGPVTLESLLAERCQVITSATLARKQILIEVGWFDEELLTASDYDMWLRVAHKGATIRYQRKVLARYRLRHDSISHSSRTRMWQNLIRILQKADRTLHLAASTRALLRERLTRAQAFVDLARGEEYLFAGQFDQASNCLQKANAFLRRPKLSATLLGLRLAPWLTARVAGWYKRKQTQG